jgi:hypothetical protein
MRLIYAGIVFACASLGFADTITLKNGSVINGTYLGGTARTVRVDDGTNVQTVNISDILRIDFGGGAPPPPQRNVRPVERNDRGDSDRPVLRRADGNVVIRMIDAVDSQTNRVGQTFRATLDQPIMLDGNVAIPRGADAVVKLVDSQESGKLTGKADLKLSLQSIGFNGRMVDVNSQTVTEESSSRGARTAKVAGGTAALGAIIGGIAGGGKGAAIGAGAGAAAGAGAEVVTSGQKVHIPSETRLTFVLDNPVRF